MVNDQRVTHGLSISTQSETDILSTQYTDQQENFSEKKYQYNNIL